MNRSQTKTTRRSRIAGHASVIALSVIALVSTNVAPAAAVTVPSPGCMSASVDFHSADNSGWDRSFTMSGSLSKWCGAYAAAQYKMNFGAGVSTSWKTGMSKYTNGTENGVLRDNFYYSNSARGAWVRLCGSVSCSGSSVYIDNPYN